MGTEMDANGAAATLSNDEHRQVLSILARAASPDERRAGGWLRAIPGDVSEARYRKWAARVADSDEARASDILTVRGLTPTTWRDSLCDVEVDTAAGQMDWPAWARSVVWLVATVPRAANEQRPEPGNADGSADGFRMIKDPADGPDSIINLHNIDGVPGAEVPTLAEVVGSGLPGWVDGSAPWRFYPGFRAWWEAARAAVTRFDDYPNSLSRPLGAHGSVLTPSAEADLALGAVRRLLAVAGPRLMAAADAADQPLFSMSPRADWLALYDHYPVLARVLATTWLQWHKTTAELVARIHHDVPLVAGLDHAGLAANPKADPATDPGSAPQVVRIATGEGDSHAGGRSVAEVELTDGTIWFLKPRSSGGHQALATVFASLSAAGDPLELQLPETIERDGYCWVRKVTRADCHSPADVASYFFRAGVLTRVLQALGATDFHHENVIPAGAHPVLIDLETVFGPGGGWQSEDDETTGSATPPDADSAIVADIMADTPAATSMISSFVDGPPGCDSVDIGALAGPAEALTPYLVAHLEPTLAGPQLRRQRVPLVTGEALPTQGGVRVAATEYAGEIIAGYTEGDRRLRACPSADALLTRDNAGVRYVARPTQVYSRLLALSLGPAALGDGIERAMVIERLWRAAGTCPPQLIVAEAAALERLDVPMFTAEFTSTDLLTDTGERIVDAHATSPRAAAIARLGRVHTRSDAVDDVCAALFAMNPDLPPQAAVDVTPASAAELASTAEPAVALAHAAVRLGGYRLAWLGVDLDPSRNRWRHQRLSPGLLGEAGIGLALVASGVLQPTGDNNGAGDANAAHDDRCAEGRERLAELTQIGRTTLLTCAERMADFRPEWSSADAFAGPAGAMYALARAGSLSNDDALLAAATNLLPQVLAAAQTGSHRDLLDARAGAVLALLHLEPSPQLDDALAEVCALLAVDLADARGPQGDPCDAWWLAQLPSLAAGRALALHRLGTRLGLAELGDRNASGSSATHARATINDFAAATDLANTARAQWLDTVDLARMRPGDASVAIEIGVIQPPTMPAPPMTLPRTNQKPPAAADGHTRALLDAIAAWLSAASQASSATGPTDTLAALTQALHANRRRDGRWFTDVIVTDQRNFSVVHGLAAATIGVLATHPACPHVRVLA